MRFAPASLTLVAVLLGAAACTEESMATAVPADISASVNTGTVHAVIEQGDRTADGKVRYLVRILAKKGEMASYQGTLTFTPGSVAIDAVTVPETADGEVHIVNRDQLAEGKIRFAGYAPEELATTEAFSVLVTPRGSGTPDFAVALDVAGSPDGVAKPAGMLRGSREVRDKNGNILR
jgi:hypothetical protein